MQRGFITMAYGEKYCRLAEHLYMSYKLYLGCLIILCPYNKMARILILY